MPGHWRTWSVPVVVPLAGQPADSETCTLCARVCCPRAVAVHAVAAEPARTSADRAAAAATTATPIRSLPRMRPILQPVRFCGHLTTARAAPVDWPRMERPAWHTDDFPELRSGPPWVMQEMIEAQPDLLEAIASGVDTAPLALLVRVPGALTIVG